MRTLDKRCIRGIGAICCIICMVFMLCAGTQFAYAQNSAEVVAVSSSVEKGGIAKVSLNLSNNPGIWGLKFNVGYNHEVMTLKSVNVGDVFTEGEVTLPDRLDKEQFLFYASGNKIENISANGTLAVLEFQISENATIGEYAISLEFIQSINVDGNDVSVQMTNGKVTVVDCLHSEKVWNVTETAKCEAKGTETESCKKCGQVFGTREIKATGHVHTELKNAVAATEKAEGYTGDTYCKDCDKLLSKGNVIAKVEKPKPEEPKPEETESEESETEETEIIAPVTGEVETEESEETETKDTEEKDETVGAVDDGKGDNKSGSPIGGVIVVLFIIAAVGVLVFMYIKFIKKGR